MLSYNCVGELMASRQIRLTGVAVILLSVLVVYLLFLGSREDSSGQSPPPTNALERLASSQKEPDSETVRSTESAGVFVSHANPPERRSQVGVLVGNVSNARREAVIGATVSLYELQEPTGEFDGLLEQVLSDHTGSYSMAIVKGVKAYLVVKAEGYAEVAQWIEVDSVRTLQRDFVLQPATSSLSGKVTDEARRPIAGAWVLASPVGVSIGAGGASIVPRTVSTDSAGTYRMIGLPAKSFMVAASASGYAVQSEGLRISEDEEADVDFTLKSERTIEVTVSSTSSDILPGASATCAGLMFPFPANEDGAIEIPVRKGSLKTLACHFGAAGFKSRTVEIDPVNPPNRITLVPAELYEGEVVSDDGQPVQDARMTLRCGDSHSFDSVSAVTDKTGRFEVYPPTSPVWEVSIRARGYLPHRHRSTAPIPTASTFTLTPSEASLHGRATWSDGSPLDSFAITAWQENDATTSLDAAEGRTSESAASIHVAGKRDGTFYIPDLERGRYRLRLTYFPTTGTVVTSERIVEIHDGMNQASIELARDRAH